VLGPERVHAEPEASARLAELCGHLPLALRIAAASLAVRAHTSIDAYTRALDAGDRMATLAIDGDARASVPAALDHSYANLTEETSRLFRLLGLVPGDDIATDAAASLIDMSTEAAAELLDRLCAVHLVVELAPGRYGLHDLVRVYAADKCAVDAPAFRDAALSRLYAFYQTRAGAAADLLYPQMLRLSDGTAEATDSFDDDVAASAWLEAEHVNLTAVVLRAAQHGFPEVAWTLADILRGYFYMSMRMVDWEVVGRTALEVAEREHDRRAQAAAHLSLGGLYSLQRRTEHSAPHFTTAKRLAVQSGWIEGRLAALGNLGNLHHSLGQYQEALNYYQEVLIIARAAGQRSAEATALLNVGSVHTALANLAEAVNRLDEALAAHRQMGSRNGEGKVLTFTGEATYHLGHLHRAEALLSQAISIHQDVADRNSAAEACYLLAAVHREMGHYRESQALAEQALKFARDSGHVRLEAQTLNELAAVHLRRGDRDAAQAAFHEALKLSSHTGDRHIEAEVLVGLAEVHRRGHALDKADERLQRAIDIAGPAGYRLVEADAYVVLAATRLEQRRPDLALAYASRALAIDEETGRLLGRARAHLSIERALRPLDDDSTADAHHRHALELFSAAGAPPDEWETIAAPASQT
jgi:tetratricopeptide (TPR) repeat protein